LINEAIILAGGLGTRLRAEVADIPKVLADVNGKPFIFYLLDNLISQGFKKIILATGYKHEMIQQVIGNHYKSLQVNYVVESKPMGTGGAIKNAISYVSSANILIINGDTFYPVSLNKLFESHLKSRAQLSLALKPMHDFSRYGAVEVNKINRIIGFLEKKYYLKGLINGGTYLINKEWYSQIITTDIFSFETHILEEYYSENIFCGFIFNDYFVDIGIPEDYLKAKKDLPLLHFTC